MSTNVDSTPIPAIPPTPASLSQLLRLISEQNLSDKKLNQLFGTGLLARLFRANPLTVNLTAFERSLGLIKPLDEMQWPLLVKFDVTVEQLIKSRDIVVGDSSHNEIVFPTGCGQVCLKSVFTQIGGPRYGNVQRTEAKRGVRSADLRELLTFVTSYDMGKIGSFPIFALGSRLGGRHPENPRVYFVQEKGSKLFLSHYDSYRQFPSDARFLGITLD